MKIAVLGAGNGGVAVAADLSRRGHSVTLIKTSLSLHEDNFGFLMSNGGVVTFEEFGRVSRIRIDCLSRDIGAVRGCDIVMICVVSNYHENVIKCIAPFIDKHQIILICPGYFSTAYVMRYCAGVTVAESQSAFIDCRITEPGRIKVGFRNVRNPISVFPSSAKAEAAEKLLQTGFPLTFLLNTADAALHNPNLIVHTVGAVMSIPRIDAKAADYCMYHEVFTPHVWRILEKLDIEKQDVLEKLGCKRLSYVDACKFRNSLDLEVDGKDVFFRYAAMPERAKGPCSVESRYITEDVSQGLVLLEAFGKLTGTATPVCTALIELSSAALGRDIRFGGRTLERLGIENVKNILADGRYRVAEA